MIKAIDWVTNYNGFIGTLSRPMADAWANVIRENVKGVVVSEVDAAVASLCQEQRGSNSPKPNALTIIRRIYDIRNEKSNGAFKATPNEVKYYDEAMELRQTTMAELKQFLNRRPPGDEAWDIICTPLNTDQCRELHRYCDNNGIAYNRFVPDMSYLDNLAEKISV